MKKIFSILLIFAAISSCTSNKKQMEIQGSIDNETLNNKKVYLLENQEKIDSSIIKDNKFSFTTKFDSVQIYNIGIEGRRNLDVVLANQTGIVTVRYSKGSQYAEVKDNGNVNSTKSDLQITIRGFQQNNLSKIKRMREQGASSEVLDSVRKENATVIKRMWQSTAMINAENLAGAAVFAENYPQADREEFLIMYERIKYAHLFPILLQRKQVYENQIKTKEGAMFIDIKGTDTTGKEVSLSDFAGKGKYIIVDFWASWCGPCRKEIPNLIKVYNQFAGNKFTVIGIDAWDKKNEFQKAVEEEKIEYPQIFIEKEKKAGLIYGIDRIPHIILIAPDGKILKRGLRGEAILQAVEEALKK